jgi:hypothetical protein
VNHRGTRAAVPTEAPPLNPGRQRNIRSPRRGSTQNFSWEHDATRRSSLRTSGNSVYANFALGALQHHLARSWANLPWERGREHHGRPRWARRATDHPPMVEDVGRTSSADRSPLRPFGSQATGQTLPPRSARQGRTQERLANGRGHRREGSAGGATPAELGQVGRGGGPRRSEGVRGGAFRRRGDGRTHRRRERLPEEGREERGSGLALAWQRTPTRA